jgi:hypothetical protein
MVAGCSHRFNRGGLRLLFGFDGLGGLLGWFLGRLRLLLLLGSLCMALSLFQLLLLQKRDAILEAGRLRLILGALLGSLRIYRSGRGRTSLRDWRLTGKLLLHIGILLSPVDFGSGLSRWGNKRILAGRRGNELFLDKRSRLRTTGFERSNWCGSGLIEGGDAIFEGRTRGLLCNGREGRL